MYWRYAGSDTPLPGLTLEVEDRDVSENAEFSLTLEPVSENAAGVFYVYPETALGKVDHNHNVHCTMLYRCLNIL